MLGYEEKKKKAALALLFMVFGILLGSVQIGTAEPTLITVTRVFYGLSYDGYIYTSNAIYGNARTGQSGTVQQSTSYLSVGQSLTTIYYIYRAFLFFDTSIIPDTATITSAKLSLYVYIGTTSHFNVTIQNGQPVYPHIPLQSGDYYYAYYSGNGGCRSTSTMPSSGYWNITFNAEGLNWLQKNGVTKLCLRSSNDIIGLPPEDAESVTFCSAEKGEEYAPKLYVTYEVEGYRYILHGPYREDGSVANQAVTATVEVENEGYYTYVFNGSDGTADTYTLNFENHMLSITWTASTAYINTTRTIVPRHDLTFEEFWLYVPDTANEWADIYTFHILDLAGISWGYLEAWQTVAGQQRLIERINFLTAYETSFYLIVGRTYILRVVTNLGSASLGSYTIKPADKEYNIILTPNMFPPAPITLTPTCNASRVNATYIKAAYANPNMTATWVYYEIKHKVGQTWQTDYAVNSTLSGVTDTLNWYDADNTTDYVLDVEDSAGNVWTFSLPAPPRKINPWQGLDALWKDSPIRFSQVVGAFLVLMVLGVFSYVKAEVGMLTAWITSAILWLIGWLEIPFTLLMFALVIVIFAAIAKARRTGEVEI
ncbi:MAG: DNRLRE domain-containing protein [Candidatus Bathyarchaeia archaeon]